MDAGVEDPLVEACRSGDESAWRALYDGHFDFAYRTAGRLGLAGAEVEDAVQDAFTVVFRRLPEFRHGPFRAWLFRILSNVVAARLRRQRIRAVIDRWRSPMARTSVPDAHGRVEAAQLLETVRRLLLELPREKREAFVLHELEGLGHEEIAELVGAKVETVRTRVFYARRLFEERARRAGVTLE